jgi:sugar phosphate isomerase/epimerase
MIKYKKGVFVNIFNFNPVKWEADFRQTENFTSLEHIEIWLEYIPRREERKILHEIVKNKRIVIHGPFIHTSLVSHLNSIREVSFRRCCETIEFANMLGAEVVTFHAGNYPVFETQQTAFERLINSFAEFVVLKAPIVTLENLPVKGGTTKECLGRLDDLRYLKSIMPDIRFTLDIGHCLQNGDDFESLLREPSFCIENIHLHDGKPGERSHLPIGAGILNLPRLIGVLKDTNYNGFISLETISLEDTVVSWSSWLDVEQME